MEGQGQATTNAMQCQSLKRDACSLSLSHAPPSFSFSLVSLVTSLKPSAGVVSPPAAAQPTYVMVSPVAAMAPPPADALPPAYAPQAGAPHSLECKPTWLESGTCPCGSKTERQLVPCEHQLCHKCAATARRTKNDACPICGHEIHDDNPLLDLGD
ncbi:unnamed protein product [Chrysoparadoxa australica]